MIKTYHDAYMNLPPTMLFDVEADPHETHDLAADKPDIVARGHPSRSAGVRGSPFGTPC